MTLNDTKYLTPREAQQFLKIGRTSLWRLTMDGKIPAYRIGKRALRYKRSELAAWVTKSRIRAIKSMEKAKDAL